MKIESKLFKSLMRIVSETGAHDLTFRPAAVDVIGRGIAVRFGTRSVSHEQPFSVSAFAFTLAVKRIRPTAGKPVEVVRLATRNGSPATSIASVSCAGIATDILAFDAVEAPDFSPGHPDGKLTELFGTDWKWLDRARAQHGDSNLTLTYFCLVPGIGVVASGRQWMHIEPDRGIAFYGFIPGIPVTLDAIAAESVGVAEERADGTTVCIIYGTGGTIRYVVDREMPEYPDVAAIASATRAP